MIGSKRMATKVVCAVATALLGFGSNSGFAASVCADGPACGAGGQLSVLINSRPRAQRHRAPVPRHLHRRMAASERTNSRLRGRLC
jgi:hypothetical protein